MRLLIREELAARWGTSKRTIDRKRQDGLLPWVDVSGGQGSRPIVRFRDDDVEEYERRPSTQDVLDGMRSGGAVCLFQLCLLYST
jgi:hypothetical protein